MHSLSDETSIVQTECCSCVAYKESCKDAEQAHQTRGRHASASSCNSFRARLIPSRQQVATPYTFVPSGHQSVNEKYYTSQYERLSSHGPHLLRRENQSPPVKQRKVQMIFPMKPLTGMLVTTTCIVRCIPRIPFRTTERPSSSSHE